MELVIIHENLIIFKKSYFTIMIRNVLLLLVLVIFSNKSHSQDFVNSDLDGSASIISLLPTSWQFIPYTDPLSLANTANWATPDLTDVNGPSASAGICGNPYSGNTLLSGLILTSQSNSFHEGIKQNVGNFIVNKSYTIDFHQAVVKQSNCLDESGSWAVYIDNTLAGVSSPTTSILAYNDKALIWEDRSITFIATSTAHTIKFLPFDDDANTTSSFTDITGALRMGIDAIYIDKCILPSYFGYDTTICQGDDIILVGKGLNTSTYLWQDGSSDSTLNVDQEGTYWVTVTDVSCSVTDTFNVFIDEIECAAVLELPNIFTPNGDGFNDFLNPLLTEGIISLETTIYSRWGNKVFETNNLLIQWDGQDVADGVYFWVATYTDIHGDVYRENGSVGVYK